MYKEYYNDVTKLPISILFDIFIDLFLFDSDYSVQKRERTKVENHENSTNRTMKQTKN